MSHTKGTFRVKGKCLDWSVAGACLGAAVSWPPAAGDAQRAQSHCCLH